jgi:hypothetical protein
MHQCLRAAETMLGLPVQFTGLMAPGLSGGKRKSVTETDDYSASKRQALASPLEPPPFGLMRTFDTPANSGAAPGSSVGQHNPALAVVRPAPNGYSESPSTAASTSTPTPQGPPTNITLLPNRRKRGRPSKADRETARVRDAGYRPVAYTPIKAAPLHTPAKPSPASHVAIAPSPTYQVAPGNSPGPELAKKGAPAMTKPTKPDSVPRSYNSSTKLTTQPPSQASVMSAPLAEMGAPTEEEAPESQHEADGEGPRRESPVSMAS